MKKCNVIVGKTEYKNYPLQQSRKTESGYYKEILDVMIRLLLAMQNRRWNLVFALHLRFPVDYPFFVIGNMLLMQFLERFAERLKYKMLYHYLWVREQDGGLHPHYHIIFIVDGDRCYSGWDWMEIAQEIWAKVLKIQSGKGLVHVSDPEPFPLEHAPEYKVSDEYKKYQVSYGMMIDTRASDADARREEVFDWICYFAKVYSKHSGTGCRSFGTSRF